MMDRRFFIQGAGALLGAAAFSPATAKTTALPDAGAERLSSGAVQLRWSGLKGPAKILVSPDADAAPPKMTLLAKREAGPAYESAQPKTPRPYFLLEGRSSVVRTAERLLPLDGGRNFRDMGGYRSKNGKQVRWGRLYRSGVMTDLTASDISYLSNLGVRTICDLRSPDERTREPTPFTGNDAPHIVAYPYDMSGGAMKTLMAAKTREDAVAAFSESYVEMTSFLTPHLTDMFTHLKQQQTLAINCTAGKDRTGISSALILSVLDVPRETIIADYALTEKYQPVSSYISRARAGATNKSGAPTGETAALARLPNEAMSILLGSDPEVMRRALARIDAQFGGPVELVKARYGVSDKDIAQLRSVYLYQS